MGQFSWLYSDTGRQVVDGKKKDTYLLVPSRFAPVYGTEILEPCYDGYGHFGGHDIFLLIAEWNRDMIPEIIRRMNNGTWHTLSLKRDTGIFQNYYNGESVSIEDRRWIGILMSVDNSANRSLEFPIKITEKPYLYEDAEPSRTDPNQGWER